MKTTEEALKLLNALKDKWATQANFLEETAGYNEDLAAQFNKAQERVVRECIGDLYHLIEDIKETF
jgi:hypothetical protein